MSGPGPHRTDIPDHVSLADTKRCVLILLPFVYFLEVKVSWLIVRPWSQILIAVSGGLRCYDLIRVVHGWIQVLLLLLLLDGSL